MFSRGLFRQEIVFFLQSISGFSVSSHTYPRRMSILPRVVMSSMCFVDRPAIFIVIWAGCVISPPLFGVPSTFETGIGLGSLKRGILFFVTNKWLIQEAPAPESTRASVSRESFLHDNVRGVT